MFTREGWPEAGAVSGRGTRRAGGGAADFRSTLALQRPDGWTTSGGPSHREGNARDIDTAAGSNRVFSHAGGPSTAGAEWRGERARNSRPSL